MSKDEIGVEYLGRTTLIKKPQNFSELESILVSTFYLTERMKKKMIIIYCDQDLDEIELDSEKFNDFLTEGTKLILNVPEGEKKPAQTLNINEVKQKVEAKKKKIEEEIQVYKSNLEKMFNTKIEERMKIIDEKNEKELKELEEHYKTKLEEIKKKITDQTKTIFEKITNQSTDIMIEKLEEYNKKIEEEIEKLIIDKENSVKKKENEVDFKKLEDKQKEVANIVEANKNELNKMINQNK